MSLDKRRMHLLYSTSENGGDGRHSRDVRRYLENQQYLQERRRIIGVEWNRIENHRLQRHEDGSANWQAEREFWDGVIDDLRRLGVGKAEDYTELWEFASARQREARIEQSKRSKRNNGRRAQRSKRERGR